ncbi:S-layer homology domain-containing protein [Zhenhengia yiwuensis]|uniref:S-layer homology domain-containing protein n=1 Tax=Zhenhengia yiwuensis TaxID=2763666 RepID=A0A926EL31_9FIRM|nr:S-layer homology domain-containing protein [Zhenhengia yiwuensis]MBC8581035.1 S-layer homology domain-containing protein [Zhenhengia yiwuensis]MBS5800727.1 S-layer homology domain-containing protein [Clostridiales bacterium]
MCKTKIKQVLMSGALAVSVVLVGASSTYAKETNVISNHFTTVSEYKNNTFSDVALKDWFSSSVQSVYELGLMSGESEDKFNPNGSITVAQSIAIASRVHAIYHTGSQDVLNKYSGDKWYSGVEQYAIENNLIKQGDFTNESMNRPATRAELIYILDGAIPETMLEPINSVENIKDMNRSSKYGNEMYRMVNAGVISGYQDNTIKPNNKITRAETSAIVSRLIRPSERVKVENLQNAKQYDSIFHVQVNGTTRANFDMVSATFELTDSKGNSFGTLTTSKDNVTEWGGSILKFNVPKYKEGDVFRLYLRNYDEDVEGIYFNSIEELELKKDDYVEIKVTQGISEDTYEPILYGASEIEYIPQINIFAKNPNSIGIAFELNGQYKDGIYFYVKDLVTGKETGYSSIDTYIPYLKESNSQLEVTLEDENFVMVIDGKETKSTLIDFNKYEDGLIKLKVKKIK